jgi:hypothetical protein
MPQWLWIVLVVAVLIAIAVGLWVFATGRRRAHLRGQFGPEYDRAVSEHGSRRGGEAELARREEQRERLDIVPLSPEARERYFESWRNVQTGFVDEPSQSLNDADRLVTDVMRERGYPMDEFDQRVADISVDHPQVVEHYRAAHAIQQANENGDASTEDLRQAVVHYRALFTELLETKKSEPEEARDDGGE